MDSGLIFVGQDSICLKTRPFTIGVVSYSPECYSAVDSSFCAFRKDIFVSLFERYYSLPDKNVPC